MSISGFAQETMCYMGQHLVFSEAEEVVNTLTGAGFNAKQIERVCHRYGQCMEDRDINNIEVNGYEEVLPEKADQLHYVSVDGSMYLTLEEGWKEVKLGHIYQQGDIVQTSDNRTILTHSQYVAHLGNSKVFLPKMEYYVEGLKHKIFIADGAKWIWNWVEDTYPDCVQIVDFFHAKEHLCGFAKEYFKGKKQREQWVNEQSSCMIEQGITPVIEAIENLPEQKRTKKKMDGLLNYYRKNRERMQYHVFKSNGWHIGSGAIEAAHRDVLQQRLKLTGQRWTKEGLQQIAKLRVVHKSGQWNRIKQIFKEAA